MHYKYPRADEFKDVPRPDFHAHSGNLILYGAGVNGLIASVLLKKMGVEFICFADSDEKKWGTKYMDKPVISPQELKEKYTDVAVMVTPYTLRPVYKMLREMGYTILFDCLHLFLEFDTEDVEPLLPKERYLPGQFIIAINSYMRKLTEFHLFGFGGYKALTIFLTEKCTLRCKDCLNFIPFYKSPKDCDFEILSKTLDRLLRIDRYAHVTIEGGEIFLYNHLPEIINKLISSENINFIYPITNGTILPDMSVLNNFKNEKVVVRISDYGDKSIKMEELSSLFKKEKVTFNITKQQWYRLDFNKFNRSDNENQIIFNNCCKSEGPIYVFHGKLYRCAFAAHLERLGIIAISNEDSVDLSAELFDDAELNKKINELYTRDKFIKACCYCRGRSYLGVKIPIAEQAIGELPPLPRFTE